ASFSPISWVAMDLTLITRSPVDRTSAVTISLASIASAAQCTCPPAALTADSSCSRICTGRYLNARSRRLPRAQHRRLACFAARRRGATGALPRSLRDVLLERVARLDRKTQSLLRLAAARGAPDAGARRDLGGPLHLVLAANRGRAYAVGVAHPVT